MALDRFKHSIIYEQSTSEIKDDIVSLVSVVRTGHGGLNRQEAGFLLWYHALEGEDKQDELVNNNVVNACLTVMDTPEASSADKTCCAGILMTLCQQEHNREQVIKGKSPNNTASTILHRMMTEGVDLVRQYSAKALSLVAEEAASRSVLLRSMEQTLPHDNYRTLLITCNDGTAIASLANLISALLNGRPDLKSEALSGGLADSLLQAMRYHKADTAAGALASCLLQLAMERESWPYIHKAGGIQVLVDMLGPPPPTILKFESDNWRHMLDKEYAAELARKKKEVEEKPRKEEDEAKKNAGRKDTGGEDTATSRNIKENSLQSVKRGSSAGTAMKKAAEANKEEGKDGGKQEAASGVTPKLPDPDPSTLLSINSSGLKWHAIVTVATYSAVAGCLYELAQKPEYMHEMSARLAASRCVPLLALVMEAGGDGKKKKGKKKGLSLAPEQIEALTRITGCLKFLSLVNTNRCRIARYGAIPHLVPLYEEGPQTLLRRNAQVILSNIAMMAENGQIMLEAKLPEEFLIPVPMRLTADEKLELDREFPPVVETHNSDSEVDSPRNVDKLAKKE